MKRARPPRRSSRAIEPYRVKDLRPAAPAFPYFGEWAEYVPGGWQQNLVPPTTESKLAFSAIYACVSLIAGDISKLRLKLTRRQRDGTWQEIEGGDDFSPFLKVLQKPNHYETRKQFIRNWVTMKLLHGNSYQLKQRKDARGIVTGLYVLDPVTTTPLVAEDGSVFYRLGKDRLSGFGENDIIVPASELIHDRMSCFWHPLIGVSPIFAAGSSAAQGNAIQANASTFFANQSRPSGMLIYPQAINLEQAQKVKTAFETGYSGANMGKFAVLGGDAKYVPMTMPAHDAQLVEQLRWTVEDAVRPFHVPPYKVGLQTNVTFSNAAQLNQDYYSQCLQDPIEDLEALLDEGLELPADIRIEFDLDGFLRMDPAAQADIDQKEVGAGVKTPNEARRKRNLPPQTGGDALYLQQQYYSLGALAKRDAQPDPFAKPEAPAAPAAVEETDETDAEREETAKQLAELREKCDAQESQLAALEKAAEVATEHERAREREETAKQLADLRAKSDEQAAELVRLKQATSELTEPTLEQLEAADKAATDAILKAATIALATRTPNV